MYPADNDAFMRDMALQEQVRRDELEETGQLIAAEELAQRLEMSAQAVGMALESGRLFTLRGSSANMLYPAFFADSQISQTDLEEVMRALSDIPASAKWQFFTTPKASLRGLTPLEALRRKQCRAVVVSAAGFVER